MSNASAFAILQQTVAPDMQGRVFTLLMSLSNAITPLSMAVAGPVADAFGVQAWFVMGGAVCVAMGIAGFFIPAVTHLEESASLEPGIGNPRLKLKSALRHLAVDPEGSFQVQTANSIRWLSGIVNQGQGLEIPGFVVQYGHPSVALA